MSDKSIGIQLIESERTHQIDIEGFDLEHDKQHKIEELATVAAYYALPFNYKIVWPDTWDKKFNKKNKHGRIKQLKIAGALCAAEIDRLIEIDKQKEITTENTTFKNWIAELQRVAFELFDMKIFDESVGAGTAAYNSWQEYYSDGSTPLEALLEDFSYA